MTVRLLDRLTEGMTLPDGYDRWGMKTVDALRHTKNEFAWPTPGGTVRSWDDVFASHRGVGACPRWKGDGLTIAVTAEAMSSGGLSVHAVLLVAYRQADVRGVGTGKIRTLGDVVVVKEWLLKDVNLIDVYLKAGDFAGVDLGWCDLAGANLTEANLRGADLNNGNHVAVNLSYANLRGAYLKSADLALANLTGANLRGADLVGVNLKDANLMYADLAGADLKYADLMGANVENANFDGALLHDALRAPQS